MLVFKWLEGLMEEKEKKWFYEENGERKGPISEEELRKLIDDGKISYGTLVWTQEFPSWKKIEETKFLEYLSRVSPPPLRGEAVDNTIVWILAFAPLIGTVLEYAIAYAKYGDSLLGKLAASYSVQSGEFWYVTLLLNIGLSWFDERRLRKAGYDTSKFGKWIWLVPVYLYKRAKACGHSLAYFIAWMVCFFLTLL